MARLARIIVPELPHHVTQRGNRREAIWRLLRVQTWLGAELALGSGSRGQGASRGSGAGRTTPM